MVKFAAMWKRKCVALIIFTCNLSTARLSASNISTTDNLPKVAYFLLW